MKKRDFIKTTGIFTLGALLVGCNDTTKPTEEQENKTEETTTFTAFELPKLDYDFGALEPNIDAQTMEIHHGKHHAGYTKKLNKALINTDWAGKELSQIMAEITDKDENLALRNNGGGYYNHKLFWKVIAPNAGGEPTGELATAINGSFGSFDNFATQFKDAAKSRFGSGWAWLIKTEDNKLAVTSTPNQDNPLMTQIVETAGSPLLGIDVWEHAYYLHYQNKRGEYINNFFNIINWKEVAANFAKVK